MRIKKSNAIALNMIANVLAFGVSSLISFFITPYITEMVGIEAYGLIGLANSFVNYITVITSALNSMASRFIIIELHKDNTEEANKYYSSVLIANTIFALILLIPAVWLIANIQILNVDAHLILDAKITFSVIFVNFVIGLLTAFWGIVLYAKNMLWKGSLRTLESNLLRIVIILVLFRLFGCKVYYVVLATALAGLYPIWFNHRYTNRYIPELKVRKKHFSFAKIKKLLAAGIWNSITKLSQILLDGLDLLLSNLFVNSTMTGNVSIAKTIPGLYTTLLATLSDSFYPNFLELYSKSKKEELLAAIRNSINVLSLISGTCLSLLIIYAKDFYMLWMPSADSALLRDLTVLSTGTVLISGCIYSMFSVFSLTNKLRANSLALLITGVLSTFTTFMLLKFTDLGIYAIVGVSSLYGILRNLCFTPLYAAKCLDLKPFTFYPTIFKNLLIIGILMCIEYVVKQCIPPCSWGMLLVNGIVNIPLCILITFCISFSKKQKQDLLIKIKSKTKK